MARTWFRNKCTDDFEWTFHLGSFLQQASLFLQVRAFISSFYSACWCFFLLYLFNFSSVVDCGLMKVSRGAESAAIFFSTMQPIIVQRPEVSRVTCHEYELPAPATISNLCFLFTPYILWEYGQWFVQDVSASYNVLYKTAVVVLRCVFI